MSKTIYFIVLVFVFATGCSEKKKTGEKEDIVSGKKKGGSIKDSYTTDTLYQSLPDLLDDLTPSENMQDLLAQNWIMEDDKDALKDAEEGVLDIPVRSLSMYADNTVIRNLRNSMETGTWKFDTDKKIITFSFTGSGKDVYKLRALAADEMKLTNIGIKSETVLKFVSDAKRYKDVKNDPFYISNNKWRIAPGSLETGAAIKQRLKDNLQFFILFYKDAIARRAELVSFYGFPSCLKWYAGGIYLQKDKEISEKWEACFYSKAQAKKAYTIMDGVLSKKYTWPKGTNWIKQNLFVLEQMYKQLQ